jgi:hypothetical protein
LDERRGAVVCLERGEPDLDLALIGVGRERGLDDTKAQAGIVAPDMTARNSSPPIRTIRS